MHHSFGAGALEIALMAGGVSAFAGALVGMMILGGRLRFGAPAGDLPRPDVDARLTVGAFLLASHAIAAAAVWQVPTVGACMAAALGSGWIGAAAAGLIGMMGQADRLRERAGGVALRAAIGFGLIAPLWGYVQVMHAHAMGALGA